MSHLICVYMKPLTYISVKIIFRAWGQKKVNLCLGLPKKTSICSSTSRD